MIFFQRHVLPQAFLRVRHCLIFSLLITWLHINHQWIFNCPSRQLKANRLAWVQNAAYFSVISNPVHCRMKYSEVSKSHTGVMRSVSMTWLWLQWHYRPCLYAVLFSFCSYWQSSNYYRWTKASLRQARGKLLHCNLVAAMLSGRRMAH